MLVVSLMESRIEAYENRRRTNFAYHPPVLSTWPALSQDVILERHATPESAEYRDREIATHILFLFEGDPRTAAARAEKQRFDGTVRSGDVWLIPRFMRHTSRFAGSHGGLVLSIGNSALEHHAGELLRGGQVELAPRFDLKDGPLEHMLRGLLAVTEEGERAERLVAELMVNAVCVHLAKRYAVSKLDTARRRGGLPPARLKRVLEYIEGNLDKSITLSGLAKTAEMSVYYFSALFKQSTSLSPHRYVLRRRIQKARQLLRETNASVLEVGLSVGFERQNNFARAFRRLTGVSPRYFRSDHFGDKK